MGGRVLRLVGGAALLGSLVVGCGAEQAAPDEVDPGSGRTHAVGEGRGPADEDREREPEGNVVDDEVILVVDDEADVHEDCEHRKVIVSADNAKVVLDALFGRESFLNEIIWAYDYGAKSKKKWPAKHDNILVYVKDPENYYFNSEAVDREPYMAPGLVTPEKAEIGKLPTDVWWHTIVSPSGKEKTGYATQKPLGILRRIVQASSAPGDWVLDFFGGSGTTGHACAQLDRNFLMIDQNPEAIKIMRKRLKAVDGLDVTFKKSRAKASLAGAKVTPKTASIKKKK